MGYILQKLTRVLGLCDWVQAQDGGGLLSNFVLSGPLTLGSGRGLELEHEM